jgi:hypothetical protein
MLEFPFETLSFLECRTQQTLLESCGHRAAGAAGMRTVIVLDRHRDWRLSLPQFVRLPRSLARHRIRGMRGEAGVICSDVAVNRETAPSHKDGESR